MTYHYSIDDLLAEAQLAIDGALSNADIQAYLAPFGYPLDRLREGKTLYEAALQARQQQKTRYAEQYGATATLKELRERASQTYTRHVKLARVAFKNDVVAVSKLGIEGQRERDFAGWLAQTRQFYTALLEDDRLQEEMAKYGVTKEAIAGASDQIEAVVEANVARETEKGEAQKSTLDRNAAIDALLDWTSDYIAVARVALEEDSQLLEALGIVEPA